MLLPLPHFPQEHATSCLPACVQMVLSFWGIERSQAVLSHVLQAEEEGTSVLNIELLQGTVTGITVWAGEMNTGELKHSLDEGVPVVVAVMTGTLPYWKANRRHSVVVVGYDDESVHLNDPKFPGAPQTVTWGEFLVAWEAFGWFRAIIRKH